jgi:serine/threonine protein kinase/tetratricopeptide (TPR) repeat protein
MPSSIECDERVIDVVADALQKPPEERELFVSATCNGDEKLRRAVMDALADEDKMGAFLSAPWIEFTRLSSPFACGEIVADRFAIVREIGEGGMGVVYEALDRKRNLKIAIKAAKPGFQRLLTPELEGALKVRHPNICLVNQIHTAQTQFGEIDFLSMEFLDGETLADRLERVGALPEPTAMAIARQLCLGLAEAHRSGVIHRDLKTSNVILAQSPDGSTRAVITDFGLAGNNFDADVFAGTPQYIAPEIWHGKPASQASDIYSLGVILLSLVKAGDIDWRAAEDGMGEVPSLDELEGLSHRWAATIGRCLDPSPDKRPKDALEVLAGLEKRRSRLLLLLLIPLLAASSLISHRVRTWAHNLIWPPPALRLVVLPPAGAESGTILSGGTLQDVSRRLSNLRSGARSVAVISPADAKDVGVQTPEQARNTLHATHALETSAVKQGDDTVVQGSVIELETQTHVRDFTFRYTPETVGALPGALAGEVSSGLGLEGGPAGEALSPAATGAYDRGLNLSLNAQKTEEAIRQFQDAARLDPRSALPLAALVEAEAQRFYETKDAAHIARAQQYLQTAESLNPDSISVHFAAGRLYETTGKVEKALEEHLRVQSLAPSNIEAARRAAWDYDHLDMPEKALAEYRRAIALDPAFFETYSSLGGFYYYRGNYSAAAEQWRKTTELAPGAYSAWAYLGAAQQELGDYPGAEQALRKGLQLRESPELLQNMGALLSQQGHDSEAVPYYERAAVMEPGEHIVWFNLGDSNRRLGHRKAARENYLRGLTLAEAQLQQNPQNAVARSFAGYFTARLGQRARALAETAQALHTSPSNSSVLRHAVLTYEALRLRQRALDCLIEATPEFLRDLEREPELADFCRDPRFQQLVSKSTTGGK